MDNDGPAGCPFRGRLREDGRDWSDGTAIPLVSVSETLEIGNGAGEPVCDGWRS